MRESPKKYGKDQQQESSEDFLSVGKFLDEGLVNGNIIFDTKRGVYLITGEYWSKQPGDLMSREKRDFINALEQAVDEGDVVHDDAHSTSGTYVVPKDFFGENRRIRKYHK